MKGVAAGLVHDTAIEALFATAIDPFLQAMTNFLELADFLLPSTQNVTALLHLALASLEPRRQRRAP
jgi:hypothetical protein